MRLGDYPDRELLTSERIVAWDREETEQCTKLTPGCSIDHEEESRVYGVAESSCETW